MKYRNNCPSCNSADVKVRGPKGKRNTNILGSLEISQDEYSIYKCLNCGLYFRSPILGDKELELHYSNYDYKVLHNSEMFPTERAVYGFLKKQVNRNLQEKMLDYGCNEGFFLSLFLNDYKCYGFEIDDRVKRRAEERGIVMLDNSDFKKSEIKFDYIILIDVFEHLKDPTETISNLLDKLKKSGKLVISTGYADSPCCKRDLANYWYFSDSLQHLCMIGGDYIKYIKAKFGLRVLFRKRMSHYDFTLSKKLRVFYYLRYKVYLIYQALNRIKGFSSIIKHIPILKKPMAWPIAPYSPYVQMPNLQRDHIVLVFEKPH